jgi:hypothetical protein
MVHDPARFKIMWVSGPMAVAEDRGRPVIIISDRSCPGATSRAARGQLVNPDRGDTVEPVRVIDQTSLAFGEDRAVRGMPGHPLP